jgi:hypothetical protein
MNEEALKDAYNLFVQQGYKKSIDEFKQLIATNPDALKDSYNLFTQQGYNKTIDDYKTLMGVSDVLKKKEEPILPMAPQQEQVPNAIPGVQPFTGSPLAGTPSELPSSISEEQPETPVAPVTPSYVEPTPVQPEQGPLGAFNQKIIGPDYGGQLTPEEQARAVKIQQPEVPEEEKEGYWKNFFTKSLPLGINQLDKLVASAPEAVVNALLIPQNFVAWATGLDIATNADKLGKDLGISNPILKKLNEEQEYLQNKIGKFNKENYEKTGIYENIKDGNYSDAFALLGNGIIESAPISVAMMFGGATLSAAELTAAGTLLFSEGSREQLNETAPNMPEIEKTLKSLAMASAETVFSQVGTGTIGQVYKDIIKKEGLETGKVIFRNGLVDMYKTALKKYGAPIGLLGEGIEEVATQVTQNVISGKPAFEGAADAFIVGGGSGVVFATPITVMKANENIKNIVETNKSKSEINTILKDKPSELHQVFNVPQAEPFTPEQIQIANTNKSRDILVKNLDKNVKDGVISSEDAKQSVYIFDKAQQVSNAVKDLDVSIEKKTEVANLLSKRNELKTKIENKEDVLVVKEKQQIDQINKQISNIILEPKTEQNAIQEQAADESVLRTGQPEVGLQEVVKGNVQPEVTTAGTQEVVAEQPKQEEVAVPEIKRESIRLLTDEEVNPLYDEIPMNLLPIADNVSKQDAVFDAYFKSKQNNTNPKLIKVVESSLIKTPKVSLKTQEEVVPVEITPVVEVEQYVPITEKEVRHEAFTRDNAIDYEEDYKTGDNGREYSYISRLTVELLDNDGNAIGRLIKLVDEDGVMSFQAEDIDGNELSLNGFDTKGEAKKAIVDKWNKIQKKEFDKEVKKKAKIKEKKSKFAKDETIRPQPTGDGTGRTKSSTITSLEGTPSIQGVNGADPQLIAVAEQYAKENGIPFNRQAEYVKVDEERAARLANAYEQMVNDPKNPKVKEAYQNLIKQTIAQYEALVKAGYKFWFLDLNIPSNAEYSSSPYNAIRDLRKNKEMGVFPTTDGYGASGITESDIDNNPLLADTGIQWTVGGLDGPMKNVLANDLFRAVHDAFGHGLEGSGFRARGEENAWQAHVRLFTGSAIGALTSETRGQNSWLNYGPNGEKNRTAKVEDTVFAEQKIGLMPEWTSKEGLSADIKPTKVKTEETPITEEQSITDELMNLDVNDEDSLKRILDALDRVDENISKKLFGGANESLLAIPLGTVQLVIKSLKALVKGGMLLRDAIRKVATDNNISQESIKDILNIAPIQEGFNSVMSKVDAMIERQKQRGVEEKRIISNVDTLVRNEEVYKNADDAQKKILEREARVKLGVAPRRAPSIGRVLGVLKDITNISRQEKLQVIKQIRELSRDAAKDLANEIKELAKSGTITPNQAANVIARFGKVNMLNEVSVSNFVDYMSKVFENADYVNKIQQINSNLKTAKKNIGTKIGTADGLVIQLQRLFSINPTLIPEESFNKYSELVNMFGQKQAVLSLEEKSKVIKDVNSILENIDEQESKANVLADRFNQFEGKIFDDEGRLQYADTINQMVKDEVIDDNEAELMRKYKSDIAPQVGKTKMTDEEIAEEKKELIQALNKTQVDTTGLPTQYQRALANRLKNLVSTKAIEELSNTDLKNLLKVFDNINNNYLPHYAQVMVEKLNSVNDAKNLTSAFKRAVIAPLSGLYSRVKSLILGSKRTGVSEMVRRNPLFYIDQLFGDFKTKDIFNAVFNKVSEGESKFKSDLKRVQNILEKAEERVAKSFNLNGNDTLMSKFKMMTYMVQLEYDSNQGSKQVNPAADYLKATIKHIDEGKSQFGERDANMLQKILKDFAPNGEIDNQKLYDSFNNAEKSALKDIRGINESLREKAEDTAAIIRGDRINALTNYVHLNVLHEHQPNDLTSGVAFVSDYNNSLRPSTKAKSLIERTGKVSPLNFDVFASAQRGAKFVLMDYNLTEPIRTSRKTIKQTISNFEKEGRIPKEKRQIINAIDSAFEEATENVLTNTFVTNSLADDFVDYVNKQGYRAVLAGTSRFVSELSSNIGFAIILDPKAFATGVANKGFIMSVDAPLVMENVNSKQTNRIFPTDTLSGKVIDTNILQQTSGIKGAKSKNPVANKTQQIWNLSGKKYLNTVELTADALISTPDKIVMRPMWFGSFANEFKNITGEKVDFNKIAANDESYMNQYKEAIEKAKTTADERAVMTGATDNPFMGILKGTVKPDQKFLTRSFNNFNNFMTRFMIYEYVAARTGIMAAMGNGSLTKKQGVAVLGAVTTRMVVYTLMIQMLGTGLMGLVFGDEEEPEDEKSFMQKLGQAFASAFTSLVLGRDFGNATKQMINIGVERVNENYLDFLREGDYDPYKDAIQYSIVPPEKKGKQTDFKDFLLNMGGAFGPALKTADLIGRKILEPKKEEDDAIERQEDEIKIRIPLEILGNTGFVPLYKDIRKVVLKDIYKSLEEAERTAADKKRAEKEKLHGYKNKSDMERYDPELWDKVYGPNSPDYDKDEAIKEIKRAKEKLEREAKDEMYNYVPKSSKTYKFGPQKSSGKSKSEYKFGPQSGTKKSEYKFGPQ